MKRFVVILALLLTAGTIYGQDGQEGHGRADLQVSAFEQFVAIAAGADVVVRESATALASCTPPDPLKGNLTLGGSVNAFLGDSHSCFQGGVWVDFWTFSAPAGQQIRVSFTSTVSLLVTIQDYSTGNILARSDTSCGLATSCTFFYNTLSAGQYFLGVGSFSTGGYTLAVSSTGGLPPTGQPNLTPYRVLSGGSCDPPSICSSSWSDKIVVSNTPGTHNDNSLLSPADILYVDWAVINNGTGAATARFNTEIYVDGVRRTGWFYDPPLNSNHWSGVQDYVIGSFAPGTHTVRIKADYTNAVPESNESDNEYTKTFTVASGASCTALPTNLCLNVGGRLRVTAAWRVPSQGTSGQATAVALSADSGYFWFFNNSNVELVVKTVDGRSVNGRFWVFYGALSNVEYTVTVTDTLTGAVKTYSNPNGTLASVADTEAF